MENLKQKQIDIITDLLIDFDEMGFAPTTLVPNPEASAIDWREKLTTALQGYRKQSEVIDEFVKRLLDAFPEPHRGGNLCPAIYYDDYREIIEECGAKMKGGAE